MCLICNTDAFMISFRFDTPPVVKNLLIINGIMFLATLSFESWLIRYGALFPLGSGYFQFHQVLTHLFLHGSFLHLFFNMLVLWSFGSVLERVWGSKRFFVFYFVCGFGAAVFHQLFTLIEMQYTLSHSDVSSLGWFSEQRWAALKVLPQAMSPAIGASGAVSGLMVGFALLFPNSIILVWFIPARAKYVVLFLLAYEVFAGMFGSDDGIANWAHVGGIVIGFILGYIWKQKGYHLM